MCLEKNGIGSLPKSCRLVQPLYRCGQSNVVVFVFGPPCYSALGIIIKNYSTLKELIDHLCGLWTTLCWLWSMLLCAQISTCFIFGWQFVKLFALCYQSVVCLSSRSVTLVYCGQMVGWIKMKLGVEVGLGSGHVVLNGDPSSPSGPSSPSEKGAQSPTFRPMSIVAKWLDGSRCHLVWR